MQLNKEEVYARIYNSFINITVPNNVKDKIYFKTEEPKILTKEFVCKLIDEISEYDINETVQEILQEPEKWKKYI